MHSPLTAIQNNPRNHRTPLRPGALELPVLCATISVVLVYAWIRRDEGDLTAETGAGYYLGIAGSLLMLALLLYPLRKRIRAISFLGPVKQWFRLHMMLGIVGPALIILHSNFNFGSLNSSVALTCMLVVAGSGFIGRFLYGRIHRGLYGRKAQAREFLDDAGNLKSALKDDLPVPAEVLRFMQAHEKIRLDENAGLLRSAAKAVSAGVAERRLCRRAMRELDTELNGIATKLGWSRSEKSLRRNAFKLHVKNYARAIAQAEVFTLYERLFALWHMLHLPLFVILVFAAIAHVLAVHFY